MALSLDRTLQTPPISRPAWHFLVRDMGWEGISHAEVKDKAIPIEFALGNSPVGSNSSHFQHQCDAP